MKQFLLFWLCLLLTVTVITTAAWLCDRYPNPDRPWLWTWQQTSATWGAALIGAGIWIRYLGSHPGPDKDDDTST